MLDEAKASIVVAGTLNMEGMAEMAKTLAQFGEPNERGNVSARQSPQKGRRSAGTAKARGIRVIIAGT